MRKLKKNIRFFLRIIFYYSRKNEYETATDQYCKTIGFLEPSYVIKKVKDLLFIK